MLEGQILIWGGDWVDMVNLMEVCFVFLDYYLVKFVIIVLSQLCIKGVMEKYVLCEVMKGLLLEMLYKCQKFVFMVLLVYIDIKKWKMLMNLIDEFVSKEKVEVVGLLDYDGICVLIDGYEDLSMDWDIKV